MTTGNGTARLSIRVKPDEKEMLEKEAQIEHLPPSVLARSILMKDLKKRTKDRKKSAR